MIGSKLSGWDKVASRSGLSLTCYCADHSQLIQGISSFSDVDCLRALGNETQIQQFSAIYASRKRLHFVKNQLSSSYAFGGTFIFLLFEFRKLFERTGVMYWKAFRRSWRLYRSQLDTKTALWSACRWCSLRPRHFWNGKVGLTCMVVAHGWGVRTRWKMDGERTRIGWDGYKNEANNAPWRRKGIWASSITSHPKQTRCKHTQAGQIHLSQNKGPLCRR